MLNKSFPGARLPTRRFGLLALIAALWLPAFGAHAQLLVYPRKPSQTNVRYADFDWRYVDLLTHERVDIEWHRGPRFHAMAYHPPAAGVPWAWPALHDAPPGAAPAPDPSDAGAPPAPPIRPDTSPVAQANAPEVAREVLQTAGGIRLYFYEKERPIAERAAASIESSYRYLAEQFAYAPRRTFAYFLYSSYIEFLQTDLFPVQEGVLGITSTESLELT